MYFNFFGLRTKPFNTTPDPDFLYLSPGHKEALGSLIYGIKEKKGFIAVTGQVGLGKTTILRSFLNQHPQPNQETVYLLNPNLSFTNLVKTLLRELGPVVAALLFAGRAGSALTAEIGLMKATEQLAAMEMIGVDPLRRVARPRLWAGILAMPILAQVFNMVAILGAVAVGVSWLDVDAGSFWSNMQASVQLREDVLNGVIKAFAFGVVVTWIAVFEGFDADPTPEGISTATTRTVVYSSLAVLAMDFLLTAIMFGVD